MRISRFESMGCEIAVGGAVGSRLDEIAALFRRYDAVFSRFRPDSELNRVNAAAGRPTRVSPLFAEALSLALDAAAETGGLVEPTLGRALEAAGYDRDFALLEESREPPGRPVRGRWECVRRSGLLLALPAGVGLDLNGVVKALAVDRAVSLLDGDGFVSAGGDLATRGGLDVALPGGGAVRLRSGALATSGCARRAWRRGGAAMHHLIDPRTGRPAASPWAQVTVCGATCVAADVGAKAAFLAGAEGPAWLDARSLPGRFLAPDGTVVVNEAWGRSVPPCT